MLYLEMIQSRYVPYFNLEGFLLFLNINQHVNVTKRRIEYLQCCIFTEKAISDGICSQQFGSVKSSSCKEDKQSCQDARTFILRSFSTFTTRLQTQATYTHHTTPLSPHHSTTQHLTHLTTPHHTNVTTYTPHTHLSPHHTHTCILTQGRGKSSLPLPILEVIMPSIARTHCRVKLPERICLRQTQIFATLCDIYLVQQLDTVLLLLDS